ncbi:MAG: hypothetical protein U5R06_12300 [candidate division KSB1 bacterium]|nr:hypothetical protein [candidate division KSB1 bacterium]
MFTVKIQAHVLQLVARDAGDDEIGRWTYPTHTPETLNFIKPGDESNIRFKENEDEYRIEVGELIYVFDKQNGQLEKVRAYGHSIPLSKGPVFVSREKTVEDVKVFKNKNGSMSITAIYKQKADSITWTIQKTGLLNLYVAYQPAHDAAYAGISFSFPEDMVKTMEWMGKGPFRVWKNRIVGTNVGVWEKEYNNTITGHKGFKYPEFKGYHAEMYWANLKCKQGKGFKVYFKSNDIFFRLFTPDQPENPRSTVVDFPKGDISFLHGINPIGTKFKETRNLGPHSSTYYFSPKKIKGRKLRMKLIFDFRNSTTY